MVESVRASLMALYLLALWHFPSIPGLDTNNPRARVCVCVLHACPRGKWASASSLMQFAFARVCTVSVFLIRFLRLLAPLGSLRIYVAMCLAQLINSSGHRACIARRCRICSVEIVTLWFFSSSARFLMVIGAGKREEFNTDINILQEKLHQMLIILI